MFLFQSGGNSDSANACVFVDNSCEFQSQSIVSASASGITNIVVTTAVDHPDFELDTYFSCDVTDVLRKLRRISLRKLSNFAKLDNVTKALIRSLLDHRSVSSISRTETRASRI